MPAYLSNEEIFPNFQSKPHLVQLDAISSGPVTYYLGEGKAVPKPVYTWWLNIDSDTVFILLGFFLCFYSLTKRIILLENAHMLIFRLYH